MLRVFGLPILLVVLGGPVHGQTSGLKGYTEIAIKVGSLDDAARSCGISVDALDAAMRLPLANSRIKVSQQSVGTLTAEVTALQVQPSQGCVGSVAVMFSRPFFDGRPPNASIVFGITFAKESLITGDPGYVSRSAEQLVESFTKQFIAAWLKDNM
jgi:hypothetical protein